MNYSSIEGSEDAEEHYDALTNVINDIPKHHVIIECGDFNAHLGEEESVRHAFHEKTNKNSKLLLEHATECNLHITNTLFKKKKGKQWTFISDMNGRKPQLDFIIVNKKWKNSVHNVEAYNSFSNMGSDHRLVTARMRLSLRTSKTPQRNNNYDWSVLKSTELQEMYTVTVRNRYAELSNDVEDVTEKYGNLVQANSEAAKKLIPVKKRKKQRKAAEDPRIEGAGSDVQKSFECYQQNGDKEAQQELQTRKENLQRVY